MINNCAVKLQLNSGKVELCKSRIAEKSNSIGSVIVKLLCSFHQKECQLLIGNVYRCHSF